LDALINGYSLQRNGTVVVFSEDTVAYSNSPAYPVGKTVEELFGEENMDYVAALAESGKFKEVLYDTKPFEEKEDAAHDDYSTAELGYMRVLGCDGYYIMHAKPFSLIFANRQATMTWSTALSFLLLTVVYVLTARLLRKKIAVRAGGRDSPPASPDKHRAAPRPAPRQWFLPSVSGMRDGF
jgi:hypothetical protein